MVNLSTICSKQMPDIICLKIVGGQSGQSFGHLVMLKMRTDMGGINKLFCNKLFWLFNIVKIKYKINKIPF